MKILDLIKRKLKKYLFYKWNPKWKYFRETAICKKKWYGNNYGGLYLCPDFLNSKSVVYSFGIGEDISFENNVIKEHNCFVYSFDPTPKSIIWMKKQKLNKKHSFHPYGIGIETGNVDFFLPNNKKHTSGSYVLQTNVSKKNKIKVDLKSLLDIKDLLDHKKINVLKMDVEGAEYEILLSLNFKVLDIDQIVVEFHNRMFDAGTQMSKEVINKLKLNGFEIFGVSDTFEEISFININLIK